MGAAEQVNPWHEYLDRIGAVDEGGGRAVITGPGYKRDLVIYEVGGKVTAPPGKEPTEAELTGMKGKEFEIVRSKAAVMPVPPSAGLPRFEGRRFEFRNAHGQLMMCTERLEENGEKIVRPWAYYTDEGWVPRRPPQKLPLFGEYAGRSRVMVHEGEKACSAALSPPKGHPWADGLLTFGHVAWTGGVNAVERTDWSALEGKEVWILADNDEPGRRAARRVARAVNKAAGVYTLCTWAYRVADKWDIADPPPEDVHWFEFLSQFTLAEPASRAVEIEGKTHHLLREEFAANFVWCTQTEEFIERRRPMNRFKAGQFNAAYGHLGNLESLSKTLQKYEGLARVDLPGYNPRYRTGEIFREKGLRETFVNQYQPGVVQAMKGSIRPFLAYVRFVFPDPRERKTLLRWLSLLVGCPGERMLRWGVLMISAKQGVGKSTLGDLLRQLLGSSNINSVGPKNLMDTHNGWAENCQLLVIEEMAEGKPFQVYEGLKPYITNDFISIRRMQTDAYDVGNHMSILASSNHKGSLSIPEDDRRWFMPRVTEELADDCDTPLIDRYLGPNLFPDLRRWFFRRRGDSICLYWAQKYGKALLERGYDETKGVTNRAPGSELKEEMIDRSEPEWGDRLLSGLEELEPEALVSPVDLSMWLEEAYKLKVKSTTISEYLERNGWKRQFKDPKAKDKKVRQGARKVVQGRSMVSFSSRKSWDRGAQNWTDSIRWFSRIKATAYIGSGGVAPSATQNRDDVPETDAF